MALVIRDLELADAEALQLLRMDVGESQNDQAWDQRIRAILDSSEHHALVAEVDGTLVGWVHFFLALRIQSGPFAEIGGLYVAPSYRESGVGTRLMDAVNKACARLQIDRMRTRCRIDRERSLHFYEKLDFKAVKEQRVMDRSVDPEPDV